MAAVNVALPPLGKVLGELKAVGTSVRMGHGRLADAEAGVVGRGIGDLELPDTAAVIDVRRKRAARAPLVCSTVSHARAGGTSQ